MGNKIKKSKYVKRAICNKGLIFKDVSEKRFCFICGKKYGYKKTKKGWYIGKKFCSEKCRNDYFARMPKQKNCLICNIIFKDTMSGHRKYCSQKCYWESLKRKNKKDER